MSDKVEQRLNAIRCALTGAVVLTLLFVLCWLAAAVGMTGSSHMYIAIFTVAPVASLAALAVGLCWSIAFGAVTGALIAVTYNAFGSIEQREATPHRTVRT